jgi:TonB family protein
VQLAGSASLLGRRSQILTVGIADADILEVRIMSLLQKAKSNIRGNRLWLLAAALLLALPCVGAAAFSLHLDLNSPVGQEPAAQQNPNEARERREREAQERSQDPRVTAELKERARRENLESEARAARNAALVRLAKISMDQAIQIATGQAPGKVLECSLQGEHWESPGKLAKDGTIFYHVVITSGEEVNPTTVHVLVNAIDGSVIKVAKEEPRRLETGGLILERREPLSGGTLNGKAITLPSPAYPEAAHAARVEGEVAVRVVIDEEGNVVGAEAISGPELLRGSAVEAARSARFTPTRVEGNPIKVKGTLVYNFKLGEGPPETRISADPDRPTRQK